MKTLLIATVVLAVPGAALAQTAPAQTAAAQTAAAQTQVRAEKSHDRFEQRFFRKVDANRDDYVSREEFRRRADERFDRLDVNKDGRLSRDEIRSELRGGKSAPKTKPH